MTVVRLPAKLTRPRLSGATPRVRLFERLDGWADRPLVWVAGPPGSGKTTLVSSYLSQSRVPVLWYRLDADDVDAATFFSFLTQAARSVSRKRKLVLPALTPEYLLDLPGFTRRYFRTLYEALPEGAAVVLDAYEAVSGSPIDALLALAVSETPSGSRLLVTSRESPPAALAHLETKGQLGLVSWESLRLSEAEALAIAGSDATAEVEDLRRYADGWAAGFVVVLDHVRRVGREALGSAGPVRESLFAYFVNEMFAQADEGLRRLLLRTALLPGFTVDQAQALCEGIDASGLLERLYRRHYFLDRGAGSAPVYRYHALFQAFLLSQGRSLLGEAERRELLAQAATLMATDGRKEDALDLYTQAGCWTEAEGLICALGPGMLGEGRNAALANAIGALPQSVIEESAWLKYWLGMARWIFDPAGSRSCFETAYSAFVREGQYTGCVLACAAMLDTYLMGWDDMGPIDRWGAELERLARDGHVSASFELEVRALSALAVLHFRGERHGPLLERAYQRSTELLFMVVDPVQRVLLAFFCGLSCVAYGRWSTLNRLIARVESMVPLADIPPVHRLAWESVKVWDAHRSGSFDVATGIVARSLNYAQTTGVRVLDLFLASQGAYCMLNTDRVGEVQECVRKMNAALRPGCMLDAANCDSVSAGLALMQGDPEHAVHLAIDGLRKAEACGATLSQAQVRVTLVYALLECNDAAAALNHVDRILTFADSDDGIERRRASLYQTGLLQKSQILHVLGDVEEAGRLLAEGLAFSRSEDVATLFYWAPVAFMQRMYSLALELGIETEFVRDVIRRIGLPFPQGADEHWPWPARIFTLGRFQLDIEGTSIEHRRKVPKRPLALLKFLIARRGEARVDQAIDALWPDEEADAASNALDAALHRLRRLLGNAGAISLHDGLLSLDRSTIWVDSLAFEERLDRAGSDPDGLLTWALQCYRGHFLASDAAEPWSVSMRERLRSRFIRAVALHGEELREAGELEAAAAHYARAIDVDDLIEAFYQGLMRCQLDLGRRSEGLATWERLSRSLAAGLSLQPAPDSRRLYEALRASQ